jgi:voltage-gated potassium channel Kch
MVILQTLAVLAALALIGVVLWDGFETVVLPRRVPRRFRLTRLYFIGTWSVSSALARRIRSLERREGLLAVYGPLALLLLLILWVGLLIFAFALLQWGLGSQMHSVDGASGFGMDLYFSGTTFLTLGLGDVYPLTPVARAVTVVEVGAGFGVLALVIGYLPVLYQTFSRRESRISLLDAHAGSPPTAGALIQRHPPNRRAGSLATTLEGWESWSADLLESHLSYPVLAYYRSQHEEQSWVAALTMIQDTCALILACNRSEPLDGRLVEQAAYTFAMARHASADLAQVFRPAERAAMRDALIASRLSTDDWRRLCDALVAVGMATHADGRSGEEVEGAFDETARELEALRQLYEPYMAGLGAYFLLSLPPFIPPPDALDDWQTTADDVTAPAITTLVARDRSRGVLRD